MAFIISIFPWPVFLICFLKLLICCILHQNYCKPLFSDNYVSFCLVLTNSYGFKPIFDFKNVNPFSCFFFKKIHFITTSQNLCSLFHYVNQRNPHGFLWTMWITRCITPLFHSFPPFLMCITLRIKCGKLTTLPDSLYTFYNLEYSENSWSNSCFFLTDPVLHNF